FTTSRSTPKTGLGGGPAAAAGPQGIAVRRRRRASGTAARLGEPNETSTAPIVNHRPGPGCNLYYRSGIVGPGRESIRGLKDLYHLHGQVDLVEGRHDVDALGQLAGREGRLLGDPDPFEVGGFAGPRFAHTLPDVVRDVHARDLVVEELGVAV